MNTYEDEEERDDAIIQKVSMVDRSDHIRISIRPAGGFVAKLTKI